VARGQVDRLRPACQGRHDLKTSSRTDGRTVDGHNRLGAFGQAGGSEREGEERERELHGLVGRVVRERRYRSSEPSQGEPPSQPGPMQVGRRNVLEGGRERGRPARRQPLGGAAL
jgi:hypothetical protein